MPTHRWRLTNPMKSSTASAALTPCPLVRALLQLSNTLLDAGARAVREEHNEEHHYPHLLQRSLGREGSVPPLVLQDVASSLAGPLHHVADAGLPGQEDLSGAALPGSSSLLQQHKGPGRAIGSLSMWAGTDSHIPLACTRLNRCSLNPAL